MSEISKQEDQDRSSQLPEKESESGYNARPDLQSVLSGLDEYNKHFNPGSVLGRSVVAVIEQKDVQDEGTQQMRKLEELKTIHADTLNNVGLSFEAVNSPAVIFNMIGDIDDKELKKRIQDFSEETGITAEDLDDPNSYEYKRAQQFLDELQDEAEKPIRLTEMRLNISDPEKFVSYLEFLKDNNIKSEEKESLKKIAKILEAQFIGQYDVTNPDDDRFLNLIGSLGKIIILYESLGLGDSVKKLNQLLGAAREKYLKEFLLVERKGYLNPHDYGFGPAKWHTDITPDHYDENWREALKTYQDTIKNPNAKELSDKLRDHLLQAVEIATNQIELLPRDEKYKKNNYPKFLEILERVKKEL